MANDKKWKRHGNKRLRRGLDGRELGGANARGRARRIARKRKSGKSGRHGRRDPRRSVGYSKK